MSLKKILKTLSRNKPDFYDLIMKMRSEGESLEDIAKLYNMDENALHYLLRIPNENYKRLLLSELNKRVQRGFLSSTILNAKSENFVSRYKKQVEITLSNVNEIVIMAKSGSSVEEILKKINYPVCTKVIVEYKDSVGKFDKHEDFIRFVYFRSKEYRIELKRRVNAKDFINEYLPDIYYSKFLEIQGLTTEFMDKLENDFNMTMNSNN